MVQATSGLCAFLSRYSLPIQLWIAPKASESLLPALQEYFSEEAIIQQIPNHTVLLKGPAILLLTRQDIWGPQQAALHQYLSLALPGRPVVYGGSRDKDLLLAAINAWRAIRIVPELTPIEELVDAIRKAHDALQMEYVLHFAVEELVNENNRLEIYVNELQELRQRLLHTERLATIGKISGTLMQRVKENLCRFEALEKVARQLEKDSTLEELLSASLDSIHSIEKLLSEMVALAEGRNEQYNLEEDDLGALIQRAVALSRYDPLAKNRELLCHCTNGIRVRFDKYRFIPVIINLLRNAFQATGTGAIVEVKVYSDGKQAFVDVTDNGCGIPQEIQRQIFSPFFSTKKEQGMGLGLRLSQMTVESHGGTIQCLSTPGVGTCFRLQLPLSN